MKIQKFSFFDTKTPKELEEYIDGFSDAGEKRVAQLVFCLTWNCLAEIVNNDDVEKKTMINPLDDKQYRALKKAYKKAVDEKQEQFIFEGGELLVKFAKYLIEHVENVRKARS